MGEAQRKKQRQQLLAKNAVLGTATAGPTLSIFTPSHDTKYLRNTYESIKAQPFDQWVILYNNGAEPLGLSLIDPRILEVVDTAKPTDEDATFVGRLKGIACSYCTGDIMLELDHDDMLLPTAVEKAKAAFTQDESVGFVYSNDLHVIEDLKHSAPRFNAAYGWQYRDVSFNGNVVDECLSFKPTPAAVSLIWYAPDHFRAWRRSVYEAVGGYNRGMDVLDDQDLMCRMYLVTKFHFINEPLYVYRFANNTFAKHGINQKIQTRTLEIRDIYLQKMQEAWAKNNGLRLVELGGRMNAAPGYETVDLVDADVVCDLNEQWPFEDNSIGVIRSFDVFEHLKNTIHTMTELYRVLAPGGMAYIQVPSTDGRGAFCDPSHISWFNILTFRYFTNAHFQNYLPNIPKPIRFQAIKCYTTPKDQDEVCWVRVILMKLGDERLPGLIEI